MATANGNGAKPTGAKPKGGRKRRPRGRPPKIAESITVKGKRGKLTRGEAIVHYLSRGLYVEDAAALSGVHRSTAFDWIARGEEWIDVEDAKIPESERIYRDFAVSVENARSTAVEEALDSIRVAAREGQWQAAAWFLERTKPGRYSRMERREISGADGGPITLLDLEREVAEEGAE